MSGAQRFMKAILPKSWADEMEAESRQWVLQCSNCKHEVSVWDLGGIRWKAAGNPRRYVKCPNCGQSGWYGLSRKSG
jgi:DNA-directed RNA polymerase subunit RPC12/RpoP